MATKPTIANARWATDLTNNDPPSSGQRDTGWTPNQIAVSDYFNVLGNEAYKWFQYLNDGALTGAHSITSGDLTMGAGDDVILGSGSFLRHSNFVLHIPAAMGESDTSGSGWQFLQSTGANATKWVTPTASDLVTFPVSLINGERITSVSGWVRDTSGGSHTVSMFVFRSTNVDGNTQIGATQTSDGSGSNQTLTVSGLTETVDDGELIHVIFQANGSSFTTHAVYGLKLLYDRP